MYSSEILSYSYKVDLINVVDDKIKVSLNCSGITEKQILFSFPAAIPGHYNPTNYGRFIHEFKALDKKGNELSFEKISLNEFQILEAQKLNRIEYWVEDTKDSKVEDIVYGWAGTNFEANEYFMINTGGLFGFFEEMESLPINIEFKKPKAFYGSTSLKLENLSKKAQRFSAENYHQLIDCPIIFSVPDTISFRIANTKVKVACYNVAKEKVADYISEKIKPQMQAVSAFVGGDLPVEDYTLLFFFEDFTNAKDLIYNQAIQPSDIREQIIKVHGRPMPGALEHGNSSLHRYYYFGEKFSLDHMFDHTIVHEFMHIFTPLSLHSELTGNFDYTDPKISKHIWLYEGVTDYLSGLVELRSGIKSLSEYLTYTLRPKIFTSYRFPKDMLFTELSKNILKEPYNSEFQQVYNRGVILAMLLDFEIMRLTNGEKELKDVLFSLVKKYGKNKSFKEDGFVDVFVAEVHPDLKQFFAKYILGNEPLDLKSGFEVVGVDYLFKTEKLMPISILDQGFGVKDMIEAFDFYTILEVDENSPFKVADKIVSSYFGNDTYKPFLTPKGDYIQPGQSVNVKVYRDEDWQILSLTPKFKKRETYCWMVEKQEKTEMQQKLFNQWTGTN